MGAPNATAKARQSSDNGLGLRPWTHALLCGSRRSAGGFCGLQRRSGCQGPGRRAEPGHARAGDQYRLALLLRPGIPCEWGHPRARSILGIREENKIQDPAPQESRVLGRDWQGRRHHTPTAHGSTAGEPNGEHVCAAARREGGSLGDAGARAAAQTTAHGECQEDVSFSALIPTSTWE